jgi:cytidine deaminase
VSDGPFPANAAAAARIADLRARVGPRVAKALEGAIEDRRSDPLTAATVSRELAAALVAEHGLESPRELALLGLPVAAAMARSPISDYRVGVVGIDDAGDLVFGANLEFPGADLQSTIHAEGFASLRSRARGRMLRILALTEAHPCAHCRQTLTESAAAPELRLIDPLGHDLALAELYPWAFSPRALGIDADDPRRPASVDLAVDDAAAVPATVLDALLEAGNRAHAPYSGCPSAAVLRTGDGTLLAAGCVESVSFNPTITAMQAALVELAATGGEGTAVEAAWLGRTAGGRVDPAPAADALLAAVAPGAALSIVEWQVGAS